jgi:hypothetical protein
MGAMRVARLLDRIPGYPSRSGDSARVGDANACEIIARFYI